MWPSPQPLPSGTFPSSMQTGVPVEQAVTPFLQELPRGHDAPSLQALQLPFPHTLLLPQERPFGQSESSQSVLPSQSSSRPLPQSSVAFGIPSRHIVVEQTFETQAKLPGQSVSLQQALAAMQAPLHGLVFPAHIALHFPEPPSHFAVSPGFAGQSPSRQQSASGMHLPLQSLLPEAQLALHVCVVGSHVTTIPGCLGQSSVVQQSPHWSPQRFFEPQVKSHLVPSHVTVAPGGAGQGVQDVGPQDLTLMMSEQIPLQS
jgi:hypothetical protein